MTKLDSLSHKTPIGSLFADACVPVFEEIQSLREVLSYFSRDRQDVAIVSNNGKPIGLVTLKDVIHALTTCDRLSLEVKEVMSSPVHTFSHTMIIADVLDVIVHAKFNKIVVTGQDDLVIGIIDRCHLLSLCYTQLSPLIKHEYNLIQSMAGLSGENEQNLLKLATTDTLTGIGNRRLLEEIFQAHQSMEKRYDINLFLLMFDIDNFKSINDTFGHLIGDSVLQELADLVSKSVRKSDIFIRWGGEEFIILLHYPDPLSVMKIAESICKKIDKHSFKTIVHVTCSFGLTTIHPTESLNDVMERADRALYRAKADGKNSVRMEIV